MTTSLLKYLWCRSCSETGCSCFTDLLGDSLLADGRIFFGCMVGVVDSVSVSVSRSVSDAVSPSVAAGVDSPSVQSSCEISGGVGSLSLCCFALRASVENRGLRTAIGLRLPYMRSISKGTSLLILGAQSNETYVDSRRIPRRQTEQHGQRD
jgi:hypothetical protein